MTERTFMPENAAPQLHNANLVESLVKALETTAFVSALPAPPPDSLPPEVLLASIDFAGSSRARIELLASPDLGALIVANILGDAPPASSAISGDDALKELVNVTCGILLQPLTGPSRQRFEMSVPQLRPAQPQDLGVGDSDAIDWLDAEGHLVGIRLKEIR